MTVKELLEHLQHAPPDLDVVVDDMSGGTYLIKSVGVTTAAFQLRFDSDDEEFNDEGDDEE